MLVPDTDLQLTLLECSRALGLRREQGQSGVIVFYVES